MNSETASLRRPPLGRVEITELADHQIRSPKGEVAKRFLYSWCPPDEFLSELPPWYRLALECIAGPDETRRFTPVELSHLDPAQHEPGLAHISMTRGLAQNASIGGIAILTARGQIPAGQLLNYHEARLVLQHIQHRREYFGATRKLALAINVCIAGRTDRSVNNILPEYLGLASDGSGERWTAGRLYAEGLSATQAAGISAPNPEQIFRCGLMEAAKFNPFRLSEAEIKEIVRMALFNIDSTPDPIEPQQLEYVAAHVRNSLADHLDDSPEQFREWIVDPRSNLLHRIAKRSDCPVSRSQVKKCIVELGSQSLPTVAACIDAQMRTFREAFPKPLTANENAQYEQMYLASPTFGGVPLVLLVDRLEFLRESILELWKRPDDSEAAAVVHTMMHYYAVIVGNRRDGDRLYKQRAKNTLFGHGAVREIEFVENRDSQEAEAADKGFRDDESDSFRPRKDEDKTLAGRSDSSNSTASGQQRLFHRIALAVAQNEGYPCDFGENEYEATLEPSSAEKIRFRLICLACHFDEVIEVDRSEFEFAALEVQEEGDHS